jgi:hypothetical protein
VRPGDRFSIPKRDGATDLYVTQVTWNWATLTGTVTLGYPWEVGKVAVPKHKKPQHHHKPHHHHHVHHVGRALA